MGQQSPQGRRGGAGGGQDAEAEGGRGRQLLPSATGPFRALDFLAVPAPRRARYLTWMISFNLPNNPRSCGNYPHFADEKTKVLTGYATYLVTASER